MAKRQKGQWAKLLEWGRMSKAGKAERNEKAKKVEKVKTDFYFCLKTGYLI